jgi:hypothetical protein
VDQLGAIPGAGERSRQGRHVEAQGLPGVERRAVAPGHDVGAERDGGVARGERPLEVEGLAHEPVEVRGAGRRGIGGKRADRVAPQAVDAQEDDVHEAAPLLSRSHFVMPDGRGCEA